MRKYLNISRHTNSTMIDSNDPEFYFWLRHARRSQEPVVVLDAGTGRVAIPLALQEIRVVAVEPDEGMRQTGISLAAPAGAHLTWRGEDAQSLRMERRAGMVLMAEGSFQRLLTPDDQRAALLNIHANLQVGGKLALHLMMPTFARQESEPGVFRLVESRPAQEPGNSILRWESSQVDPVEQRVLTREMREEIDPSGVSVARRYSSREWTFIWPREMRLMLEVTGFEFEAVYGGWNDEPFAAGSRQQLWLARKGL
jgi:hypothetical protein